MMTVFRPAWCIAAAFVMVGLAVRDDTPDAAHAPVFVAEGQKFLAELLGNTCNGHAPVMRTTPQTLASKGQKNMYQKVTDRIGHSLHDVLSQTCTADDCEKGDFAGCVLRLVGHDLMDYDPVTMEGGTDACINFEDPDNKGLHDCLINHGEFNKGNSIQDLYQEFCDEISLADFIVIVAEAVMVRLRPDFNFNEKSSPTFAWGSFLWGRETKTSCDPGRLPDPKDSCHAVEDNFIKKLGLSWTESAALMGVHTLGRAQSGNSGYNGWWTSGPDGAKFDNFYFISLLGAGWVPAEAQGADGGTGKYQWIRSDGGPVEDIMLNTDICMLWQTNSGCHAENHLDENCCLWASHFGLDDAPSICVDGCRFDTCCRDNAIKRCGNIHLMPQGSPPAGEESAMAIRRFAKNETEWLEHFKKAWYKTTHNGKHDLFPSDCVDNQDAAP